MHTATKKQPFLIKQILENSWQSSSKVGNAGLWIYQFGKMQNFIWFGNYLWWWQNRLLRGILLQFSDIHSTAHWYQHRFGVPGGPGGASENKQWHSPFLQKKLTKTEQYKTVPIHPNISLETSVRILEELLEWSLSCLVITNGN
jgi:hypothetical protein